MCKTLDTTTLFIAGDQRQESRGKVRYGIRINGEPVYLRGKSFKYLFMLAAARHLNTGGWIDKRDIEPGDNQIKYIYQLRQEVGPMVPVKINLEKSGHYRLAESVGVVGFDFGMVEAFFDYDVVQVCKRLADIVFTEKGKRK